MLDLAARTTVVLLARRPLPGSDQIAVDNLVPTRELVRHLVRVHGLRRLRFVGELAASRDVERRHEGYLQALAEAGLRHEHGPIEVELLESAAPPVVDHVLAHLGEIDALVCANDDLALAISRGLALRGVRVPGDIAITGWDDIMLARYVLPGSRPSASRCANWACAWPATCTTASREQLPARAEAPLAGRDPRHVWCPETY